MAYLRKQNKIYHIIYKDSSGRRKSVSTKTGVLIQANRILAKYNAKQTLNLPIEQEERILFSERCKQYLIFRTVSIKTKKNYQDSFNKFIHFAGDKFTQNYTDEDFAEFVLRIRYLAGSTLELHTTNIHKIFTWLCEKGYSRKNIAYRIKDTTEPDPEPIPLWQLDIIKRDLFLKGKFHQLDLVTVTFFCALRISEALNLEDSDIDFKNKLIRIRDGKGMKGKRPAFITMLPDTEEYLLQLDLPKGKLFPFVSKDSVSGKFWTNVNKRHGFQNTFHSLRKARGTQLTEDFNMEPNDLQSFMRHKDYNTTLKYYIKKDLNKMRERITPLFTSKKDSIYLQLENLDGNSLKDVRLYIDKLINKF